MFAGGTRYAPSRTGRSRRSSYSCAHLVSARINRVSVIGLQMCCSPYLSAPPQRRLRRQMSVPEGDLFVTSSYSTGSCWSEAKAVSSSIYNLPLQPPSVFPRALSLVLPHHVFHNSSRQHRFGGTHPLAPQKGNREETSRKAYPWSEGLANYWKPSGRSHRSGIQGIFPLEAEVW